jgi:hypothetical protein
MEILASKVLEMQLKLFNIPLTSFLEDLLDNIEN